MAGVSKLRLMGLLSGFVNKVLLEHDHMHSSHIACGCLCTIREVLSICKEEALWTPKV